MFVKVTAYGGHDRYHRFVNMDRVCHIGKHLTGVYTYIQFESEDNYLQVQESPEQILEMLNELS